MERSAVDRQTGHQSEDSSVLQLLLMDSDKEQVVVVENQSGEVLPRQLRRPGRDAEWCLAATSDIGHDRHSIEKSLHVAV